MNYGDDENYAVDIKGYTVEGGYDHVIQNGWCKSEESIMRLLGREDLVTKGLLGTM